jgi:Rho GTPase-activating protein 18/28/40
VYLILALPSQDQLRAISMLCLLLPHENRNTMRELLKFLRLVVEHQSFNKMSIHNVATITGEFLIYVCFTAMLLA